MFITVLVLLYVIASVVTVKAVRNRHKKGDKCDQCGAPFRPDTDMPCHTDDGVIWGYAWTSEEAMLKAFFPDGFFVDATDVESVKMNHPDKARVLTGCDYLDCLKCDRCEAFMDWQDSYNEHLYRNKR